ncbi:hypothetical protein JYU34_013834, partial [Plutella xylostella]
MGSQTLEILRQGVWASLTGGWFYDPHQDLFCNTVHLYIWLFLLCLPFSIYLYFPPASPGWVVYCALVALLLSSLKLLNHALHHMYDHEQRVLLQRAAGSQEGDGTSEGMEMQMLRVSTAPHPPSDNESHTSREYHKPTTSTIDLKVDVHRKNSSESSIEESGAASKPAEPAATKNDLCVDIAEIQNPYRHRQDRRRPKTTQRRERTNRRMHEQRIEENMMEDGNRKIYIDDSITINIDEGPFAKVSRRYHECSHHRRGAPRDFFKEWLYLDGNEAAGEHYQSRFARQLSADSRDNSEPSVGPPSPKKRMAHRRRYYSNYPDESCTKSAMALATAQGPSMRRNSNSTMSTIQLPLVTSTAQLVSHMRRHSNNAEPGFFASVELGAYMMEKAEAPSGDGDNKMKGKSPGVRRIKSAALEIGCPPPSVSNLSPHPNSAETIGGQMLKNPKNAVIPPPSKSLTRGPQFNLYPRNESGEGCSYPYLNYGSEIVYPIAEISDEMQTSQKETDLDSSESYSDYDDVTMKHQFRGFDWEAEQSPAARSSDSDYENNGSRSPLLDRGVDVRVVRTRTQDKKTCCERHERHSSSKQLDCAGDRPKIRLKKTRPDQNEAKCLDFKPKPVEPVKVVEIADNKLDPTDYFDKASASSKDLLIEKSSLESNENGEEKREKEVVEKKPWDHEISNSSSSIESNDKPPDIQQTKTQADKIVQTSEEPEVSSEVINSDDKSVYSLEWLFEEAGRLDEACAVEVEEPVAGPSSDPVYSQKPVSALGETSSNVPKNLGAIPKQIKNMARSRASSQKENKKRDSKKEKDENQNEEMILLDAVEAQAALVQGLECLFAATNANTVVMPNPNRESDKSRSHRQSLRGESANKTRKRSIEEVAQTSTNTLLPTSMPLLAAFLNSREFPNIPIALPATGITNEEIEVMMNAEENHGQRFRPLMDRNHRNRVRKIKRSTRQRHKRDTKPPQTDNSSNPENSVHFATSFEDTTEGAVHCFMDEYGNWMSYTFDKNGTARVQAQPIPIPDNKDENCRPNRSKPSENESQETAGEGSCGSLESEAGNSENINKSKRGDSIDHSSSNQGSNNPLLNSNNNLSTVVPINTNSSNKRFYVFDGGTGSDQPRSPVAYVTDSLLEQIEAERQSRMGLPSMHINFLMSQQRAQQQAQQQAEATSSNVPSLMPSIGEERIEINIRSKFNKLMEQIEKSKQPKPKSYYKFKLFKCWEIKVTMDRLKLMALFDRNLTFKETFISIVLAILVSILGSMVLNLGFYKDIYAFWFCFIMAGSQYSLLKSVQPDSASPVHGFNKMVVFSRPVYFCICTAILCIVHNHLEQTKPLGEDHDRNKRSIDDKPFTVYGLAMNEREILTSIQDIVSTFILFFPLAFSLGLFPQVNTFAMYLLEQIDMHIFGGNATSSLSAAVYCVARSLAAVGLLYGFAYSAMIEGEKSNFQKHNVLMSIFCALLVPISYHLSRSASDYTHIWNLIKKHLLPPELYAMNNPEPAAETEKNDPNTLSEESKKNNSESNISKQNSIGSSASKINFSSETNIAKTQKRSQTSSVSSLKLDPKSADTNTLNSNSSLKDVPLESEDKSQGNLNGSKTIDPLDKLEDDMEDPLPKKLQQTVNARLKNDLIVCTFLGLLVFGLHSTTVFNTLTPQMNLALWIVASVLGWGLHYLVPQLRKQQPWLCLSSPVLPPRELAMFEVSEPQAIILVEKIFVYLSFLERNVVWPAVAVAAATADAPALAHKHGSAAAAALLSVAACKCLRNAYSEPDNQYLVLIFTLLVFKQDLASYRLSETLLLDMALMAIVTNKLYDLLLK